MSDDPTGVRYVAGYNQFLKLVRRGRAKKVFLANDADMSFDKSARGELAGNPEIELDMSYTSAELAKMFGIEVPTAIVTVTD